MLGLVSNTRNYSQIINSISEYIKSDEQFKNYLSNIQNLDFSGSIQTAQIIKDYLR